MKDDVKQLRSAVELADVLDAAGDIRQARAAFALFTKDEQDRVLDEWRDRRQQRRLPPGSLIVFVSRESGRIWANGALHSTDIPSGHPMLVVGSTPLPYPNVRWVCTWWREEMVYGYVYDCFLEAIQ